MTEALDDAVVTLRLALEHPSLFTVSELLAKGEDFVRAAKRAVANENRYIRNRARASSEARSAETGDTDSARQGESAAPQEDAQNG